jgi:exodeoxyribonuclease VII large subunit
MREQIIGLRQRVNQAWLVRIENWKRNQSHYQSQLEMLNPQRTLERGYAVVMNVNENLHVARNPADLKTQTEFEIRLAEGAAKVRFEKVIPEKD